MSLFRRWQEPSAEPADLPTSADTSMAASPVHGVSRCQDNGSVLVAIGSHMHDRDTLDWAAAEAAARHCSLKIVHAVRWPPAASDPFGGVSVYPVDPDAHEAAGHVLCEAAARARGLAPGLSVTTYLLDGATIGAILREGRGDALIVVGRGRRSSRFPPFSRSVSWQVARRAGSPVAIVDLSDGAARGSSVGRVVVGVHDGSDPTTAVTVAFRAAQRRGVGVTVLMAWGAVEEAVRRCHDAFPDVDLRQLRVEARVGRALIAESPGAALVVFGTPAPGRLHRIRPGSLGRDVVRAARTPVVLVRPGRV